MKLFVPLVHVLAVVLLSFGVAQAQTPVMPPGAGTSGDPYRISTLSHLAWMSANCTGLVAYSRFSLQNDIDAAETVSWHGGAGFKPIGENEEASFRGHFSGNHHVIKNLTINRPFESDVGLFGVAYSMIYSIENLSLDGCQVTGSNTVGALVGTSVIRVSNCHSQGSVVGRNTVGGLLGSMRYLDAIDSSSAGTVNGWMVAGGLAGSIYDAGMSNCFSSASTTADVYYVGGLVGGVLDGGVVQDSYAVGTVSGYALAGGLAGYIHNSGAVARCYAGGAVHVAVGSPGGLVGMVIAPGNATHSYWDAELSGCASSPAGTGKTSAEMTALETFGGWNFVSTWGLGGVSYPHLRQFSVFSLQYAAGAHGSVTGWLDQVVNRRAIGLPVTALPESGCHFTQWSDGVLTARRVDANVTNGLKVTAWFAANVLTAVTDRAAITVPEGGSANFLVKLSAQPLADKEIRIRRTGGDSSIQVFSGAALTFTPANWDVYQSVTLAASEDNGDAANGVASIACGSRDVTQTVVTATEADDDYTLSVASSYGTVIREPATPYYDHGMEVILTAAPTVSCFFLEWTGDVSGTNNPAPLVMNANKRVTAVFKPVAPQALPPRAIVNKRFTARWAWVEGGAPEGELCVASNALFNQLVPGYEARYVVNRTDCPVTNLPVGRDFWYRVRRLLPDASSGPWSRPVKARTGRGMPVFRNLLSAAPAAKGVTQAFAVSNLVAGTGVLKVKSSNTNAVKATVSSGVLTLRYLWKATNTAKVTLTLTHPATLYKASYRATLSQATGSVSKVGQSALTNAGTRVAQEITLRNKTGGMIYGIRVRVKGLGNTAWLINRTGLDPVTKAPIRELPCVLPAGSQMVVRLVYNIAYKTQAKTRPVTYAAWAIMTPVQGAPPVNKEMTIAQKDLYDGLWLLGLPANRNRSYTVYHSDDGGANWTLNGPLLRATANYLMWLDTDAGAPAGRLYRVMDAGM